MGGDRILNYSDKEISKRKRELEKKIYTIKIMGDILLKANSDMARLCSSRLSLDSEMDYPEWIVNILNDIDKHRDRIDDIKNELNHDYEKYQHKAGGK